MPQIHKQVGREFLLKSETGWFCIEKRLGIERIFITLVSSSKSEYVYYNYLDPDSKEKSPAIVLIVPISILKQELAVQRIVEA